MNPWWCETHSKITEGCGRCARYDAATAPVADPARVYVCQECGGKHLTWLHQRSRDGSQDVRA